MSKKILIVGGVAGGATVATRLRRLDERDEIIVFEKGPFPSYSNCALPNYLSREVPDAKMLLMMTPEQFKERYNIDMRVMNEVTRINRDEKKVEVKNLQTGVVYEETYDKLVLSPGALPIVPKNIKGVDKEHVFTVRTVPDIVALDKSAKNSSSVVVVGGGFVGLEVCENLRKAGLNVTLVEKSKQVLPTIDYDMAQTLHRELDINGVNLIVEDEVIEVKNGSVVLGSGLELHADVVVLAIGVRPNTTLAKKSGLEIGQTGGIKVNANYQTSDRDIYAVGDAIEVSNFITGEKQLLSLAGPAQRQARIVADHINGGKGRSKGVVGSSIVRVFSLNIASTGLNEKTCQRLGIDYSYSYIAPNDKVGIMPEAKPIFFKLIFEKPSGKVLGAQAIGEGNVDKRIDVVATAIQLNATIYDLKELELCYAPSYSTARDVVNQAAMVAENILHEEIKQVPVTKVRELVEEGEYILDVRSAAEYEREHLKGAINIPLDELRDRMDEVEKDRPIYVHCRSSQRSYTAVRMLQANGYEAYNIQGSILGISHYEYYNDKRLERGPILTEYNFN